jgi:hypothetical protein
MKPVSFVLKEPLGQREQAAPAPAMPAPTVSVEPPVTAPSNRPGSWFARHWRGELTLAQSYWINMGLLSVPFGLLGAALGASGESAFADAPRVFSALTLALLAGCLIIAPWQIVGVWRAAKRHVTTGGRRFWARAAQVVSATNAIMLVGQLVAVAPLAWHLGHFALGLDTMGPGTIRVVGGGHEIQLSGTLGFGTAERLADVLERHPKVTVLRLTSPGGRMGEAHRLQKLVAARQMTTYVAEACLSACTSVFLAGRERVAHQHASFGFHQPGLAGVSAWFWNAAVEADARDMLAAGVDPAFVARARAIEHADLWTPTSDELLASHFVTRISDGSEFAIVVDDPRVAVDEIERELLQARLFRVLKLYEPEVYRAALTTVDRVVRAEGTLGDIRQDVLSRVVDVLGRRLPRASDAAAVEFGRHVATALGILERADVGLCFAYLFPQPGGDNAQLALPQAVRNQETEVIASVIESAATAPGQPPSDVEISRAFEQLGSRMARRLGPDRATAVFGIIGAPQQHRGAVCGAMRELYDEILTMPSSVAGRLFRTLAAAA